MAITETIENVDDRDQYKVLLLQIGETDIPSQQVYSGRSLVGLLNDYKSNGYKVISVVGYGKEEHKGPDYKAFWVLYTLELVE